MTAISYNFLKWAAALDVSRELDYEITTSSESRTTNINIKLASNFAFIKGSII
jgi:hypothetical protein